MIPILSPLAVVRFLECDNTSGEVIPAFAVMRVTGVTENRLQVAKPNAASDTKAVINGPTPIPIGGVGNATYDSPYFILYETADGTPSLGQMWGTGSGTWKLRLGNDGYNAIGGATSGRALFTAAGASGGGTGSLTVREVDGSPSIAMVTMLSFDQVDGFIVSNPAANEAEIDLADVSASQRGIVSLTAQTLGAGDKTFTDDVYLDASSSNFIAWTFSATNHAQIVGSNSATGQLTLNVNASAGVGSNPLSVIMARNVSEDKFLLQRLGHSSFPTYAIESDAGEFLGITGTDLTTVTVKGGIVTAGSAPVLTVAQGGTGAGTFTANGILYGNGTGAMQVTAAGTTRQFLGGNASAAPTWQALTSSTPYTATASATIANTTTETTLIGSGVGSLTLAANSITAGQTIRVRCRGYWGTDAVLAGTMRWRVKLGSTTVLDTGAITPTVAISSLMWQLDAEIVCRTTGASGTVFGQGLVERQEAAGVALLTAAMVNTATTTIDTTASQAIDVTFAWGTADADNTITASNVTVELLN